VLALAAARPILAEPPEEAARERFNLSPAFQPGETWRVVRKYRQSTVTDAAIGYFGGKNLNFSDYDAYLDLDVVVTVEQVDDKSKATVWAVRIDRFRFDVPNPLESEDTRKRLAEGRRAHLPRDAHPLEGDTIKIDKTGAKTRIFKVLDNGEDAGVTQRYPEIIPLANEMVAPDWAPLDSVPVFGEWEMPAANVFKLTDVLLRVPVEGKIRCRLASVADGVATIDFTAQLGEEFRRVKMGISTKGRITFDLKRRQMLATEVTGEVQISSKTSNLRGTGRVVASTTRLPVGPDSAPK
jgi:hypothetical protein